METHSFIWQDLHQHSRSEAAIFINSYSHFYPSMSSVTAAASYAAPQPMGTVSPLPAAAAAPPSTNTLADEESPFLSASQSLSQPTSATPLLISTSSDSEHPETRLTSDLRHCWYPLSIGDDLGRNEVVGLHLLGDPVVLYRSRTGRPVCLADYCAHRGCVLSLGRIVQGRLECKTDGWLYEPSGKVSFIPCLLPDRSIPSSCNTYSYPTQEMYGLIWVWAGPKELANPALIPNITPGSEFPSDFTTPFMIAVDLDLDHSTLLDHYLDLSRLLYIGKDINEPGLFESSSSTTARKRPDLTRARPLKMDATVTDISSWLNSFDDRPRWAIQGDLRDARQRRYDRQRLYFVPPCHVLLKFDLRSGGWSRRDSEPRVMRARDGPSVHQTIHCVPMRKGHSRLIYSYARSYYVYVDRLMPLRRTMLSMFSLYIIFQEYQQLRGQEARQAQGARSLTTPIQVDTLPGMYRRWFRQCMKPSVWFHGWNRVEAGSSPSSGSHENDVVEDALTLDVVDERWFIPNQRGVDNSAYTWRKDLELGRGLSQSQPSYLGRYGLALALSVSVAFVARRYGY